MRRRRRGMPFTVVHFNQNKTWMATLPYLYFKIQHAMLDEESHSKVIT